MEVKQDMLLEQMLSTTPLEDEEIIEYIRVKNLRVFVDLDYRVWYHELNTEDAASRRSLSHLQQMVETRCGHEVLSTSVHEAVWDSFDRRVKAITPRGLSPDEANSKIEKIIDEMISIGASDLHIRTDKGSDISSVRLRINGELVDYDKFDYLTGDALVRSMWVHYARITRNENAVNDASFYHHSRVHRKEVMMRLNEVVHVRGTGFVARMRDPHGVLNLEDIGYTEQQQQVLQSILTYRRGLAIISGPVNSGKSTTQSAVLAVMPKNSHIIEIGDPIETTQPHITHCELRHGTDEQRSAHLEELLASCVRQDVDILALTEVRDPLSARASKQLASQGKFVLTTLHADAFISALRRLLSVGFSVDDILTPGLLRGLIVQRLLPTNCPSCSMARSGNPHSTGRFKHLLRDARDTIRYRNPEGCNLCKFTGIAGRAIVAEAVEMVPSLMAVVGKVLKENDPRAYYLYARRRNIINTHQHARQRILTGEVDPEIAENILGKFEEETLLWEYPESEHKYDA